MAAKSQPSNIINRLIWILLRPNQFFARVKKEKGISKAFTFYLAMTFIGAVLGVLFVLVFPAPVSSLISSKPATSFSIALRYVFGVVTIFISSGIIHLFAPRRRGKKDFPATFKSLAYGQTPYILLLGISKALKWLTAFSLLSIVVGIWSLILQISGLSKLHGISRRRAFGMIISAGFLVFIAAALIATIFLVPVFGEEVIRSITDFLEFF